TRFRRLGRQGGGRSRPRCAGAVLGRSRRPSAARRRTLVGTSRARRGRDWWACARVDAGRYPWRRDARSAAYPLRVRPAPALGVRPALCGAAVVPRLAWRAAARADRRARRMKGLIVAIQFLTRLPTPRITVSSEE